MKQLSEEDKKRIEEQAEKYCLKIGDHDVTNGIVGEPFETTFSHFIRGAKYENAHLSKTIREKDEKLKALEMADNIMLTAKNEEIANIKSVIIAAAEEIQKHWQSHCDEDGYGPANLMRRLEKGIPSQYGYTAGAFMRQKELVDEQLTIITALRKRVDESTEVLGMAKAHMRNCTYSPQDLTQQENERFKHILDEIDRLLNQTTKP